MQAGTNAFSGSKGITCASPTSASARSRSPSLPPRWRTRYRPARPIPRAPTAGRTRGRRPPRDDTAPPPAITINGGATLVSDYRFRGISQTNLQPAIQGSITLTHASGFYASVWSSSTSGYVTFSGTGSQEIDSDRRVQEDGQRLHARRRRALLHLSALAPGRRQQQRRFLRALCRRRLHDRPGHREGDGQLRAQAKGAGARSGPERAAQEERQRLSGGRPQRVDPQHAARR